MKFYTQNITYRILAVSLIFLICLAVLPIKLCAADTDGYFYRTCAVEKIPFSLNIFTDNKNVAEIMVYSLTDEGEVVIFDGYTTQNGNLSFIEQYDGKLYIFLTDNASFVWTENHEAMSGAPTGGICTIILNTGVRPYPDYNNDGCLDITDIVLLKSKITDVYQSSFDINGDLEITDADVLLLQQYVLKGIYTLPEVLQ